MKYCQVLMEDGTLLLQRNVSEVTVSSTGAELIVTHKHGVARYKSRNIQAYNVFENDEIDNTTHGSMRFYDNEVGGYV